MNEYYCKKDKIYNFLKNKILSGNYPAGFKFSRETEFAKHLGVGQVTLRNSLKLLEEEGLIARVHGKGTFVKDIVSINSKSFLAITSNGAGIESPTNYILPGIEQRCIEKKIKLVKCSRLFFANIQQEEISNIKQDYDGILFLDNNILGYEKDFKSIKAINLPTIMPHASPCDYKTTGFATLQTNAREAFIKIIQFLANNGHLRIGSIQLKSPTPELHSRNLHHDEYQEIFAENGLDTNSQLVIQCQFDKNVIKEKVKAMMNILNPPTAIICHSDFVAIYVYQALQELNLKIPEHVAVMGYCGYPGGQFLTPPLSTVDLQFDNIGKLATDILLKSDEWWGPGKAAPNIFTPYKILKRKSTQIKRFEKALISN